MSNRIIPAGQNCEVREYSGGQITDTGNGTCSFSGGTFLRGWNGKGEEIDEHGNVISKEYKAIMALSDRLGEIERQISEIKAFLVID